MPLKIQPAVTNYAKISPLHFFSNPSEKIGRNFFAFELASEIAVSLSPTVKKALLKLGYTPERLNQSCIELAQSLAAEACQRLVRQQGMEIGYEPIEKAFPRISDKTLNALLDDVGKAWGNLLDGCCTCPTACMTNRNRPSPCFDDAIFYL